ncbi:MAG: sulfurtransferase TusA family protein [Methylacidiphilales bacterium]|nr:sulfurtransferase TusA family protein [Candidatus Methylacidiphilales bacterium]
MTDAATVLDLEGLKCPLPVLRTRKALGRIAPGSRLVVRCTDPMSVIDIPHLCHETGDALERHEVAGGVLIFTIRRQG